MKLLWSLGALCAAQQTCKTINYDGKTVKGLYFPDQEVNGVVIDYAKCVYPSNWDLNWVNANTWCHEAIGTLGPGYLTTAPLKNVIWVKLTWRSLANKPGERFNMCP